jgi:Permease family
MARCSSRHASPPLSGPSSWAFTPTTPIALAPGMGLNAYFAFTIVPELGGNWQLGLGCVFVSGLLFFALSLSPLRAWLIDAIPLSLKLGIAAGIGFFLALIASKMPASSPTIRRRWSPSATSESRKPGFPHAGSSSSQGSRCAKCLARSSLACSPSPWRRWPSVLSPWRGIAAPPPLEQPAAFACTNRICSQPVFDPAELGRTVTRNLAATGTKGYSLFR